MEEEEEEEARKQTNKHIHAKSWTCTGTLYINICSFFNVFNKNYVWNQKHFGQKQTENRSRYNLTATHTQVSRCKTNRNQIKIQPNEYKKEKNGLKMSVCANVRARVSAFIRLNNYRKVPRLVELHKYFYFYFLFWLLFEFIRLCCFFFARRCTIRKIR